MVFGGMLAQGIHSAAFGPDGITVVALVRKQDILLAELVRQRVSLSDLTAGVRRRLTGRRSRVDERVDFVHEPARDVPCRHLLHPLFPVARVLVNADKGVCVDTGTILPKCAV